MKQKYIQIAYILPFRNYLKVRPEDYSQNFFKKDLEQKLKGGKKKNDI